MGAVARDAGRLLLVRRGQDPGRGRWSLPGGRVEAGETLAQAVEREVAEETALRVRCADLVGWVERIGPGYHFVILDFAVTLAAPGTPRAGDDAAQAAWVPFSEVGRLPLVEGLNDFLAQHGLLGPG